MTEPGAKSCLIQMVKSISAMAAQLDAHTSAFTNYVLDERETHNKIDAAIIALRTRLDTLVMGVAAFVIVFLLGIVGFLLIKVRGW